MRFWDTSAIMPLIAREAFSDRLGKLLEGDAGIVVWWATRVECVSAISRRVREGSLGREADVRDLLKDLAGSWSEVLPSDRVRSLAERNLAVHPLRAADALQLASALVWCEDKPEGREFVSLDDRLRSAASRSGFTLLPKSLS